MSTQDDVTAIETALDALHDYAPGCDVYLADANAALSRLAARCAKQEAENTRLRAALKDDVLYGARLDPTPTTGVNTGGAINPPYEWWSNYIRKGDEAIKSAARAALSAPAKGDRPEVVTTVGDCTVTVAADTLDAAMAMVRSLKTGGGR